jgi:hypothetical protein
VDGGYAEVMIAEARGIAAIPLIFGGRTIQGSLTGTAIENEDTLAFSVLENIRPMIMTVPLEQSIQWPADASHPPGARRIGGRQYLRTQAHRSVVCHLGSIA